MTSGGVSAHGVLLGHGTETWAHSVHGWGSLCVWGGPGTEAWIYAMSPVLGKTSLISQTGGLAVAWDGGGIEAGGWDTRRHFVAMDMSCAVTLVAFTQLCTFAKI